MPQDDMLQKQQHVQATPIHMDDVFAQPLHLGEETLQKEKNSPAPLGEQAVVQQVADAPVMDAPLQQKELNYKERLEQKKVVSAEKKRNKIAQKEEQRKQKEIIKQEKEAKKQEAKQAKQKAAEEKKYNSVREKTVVAGMDDIAYKADQYVIQRKNTDADSREQALALLGITQNINHGEVPFTKEIGSIKSQILRSGQDTKTMTRAMDKLGDFMRQLDTYNARFESRDVAIQSLIPNMVQKDLDAGISPEEVAKRRDIYIQRIEQQTADFKAEHEGDYALLLDMNLNQIRQLVDIPNNYQEHMEQDSATYWEYLKTAQVEQLQESSMLKAQIDALEVKINENPANVEELKAEQQKLTMQRGDVNSDSPDIYYLKKNNGYHP